MLDTGCWIQDAGSLILDTGYWVLDAEYWMRDAGYGYSITDSRIVIEIGMLSVLFALGIGRI